MLRLIINKNNNFKLGKIKFCRIVKFKARNKTIRRMTTSINNTEKNKYFVVIKNGGKIRKRKTLKKILENHETIIKICLSMTERPMKQASCILLWKGLSLSKKSKVNLKH